MVKLILSSSSLPRKKLLRQLRIPFTIFRPNIDETPFVNENPQQLVKRLAKNKALAAEKKYRNALIIGSDQVALLGCKIQGKPANFQDAIRILEELSGQRVIFFTGICLYNSQTKRAQLAVEKLTAVFRPLSAQMILDYLALENPYDCAACVKVEGPGIALMEAIYSKDPTALMGLPLIKLSQMLENENVDVLQDHSSTISRRSVR